VVGFGDFFFKALDKGALDTSFFPFWGPGSRRGKRGWKSS